MRHVGDEERRARIAVRHALAPAHRVTSPEVAARSVVALHATEPATVALSCWARVDGLELADVDRALSDDRTLVRQLAMRRTLFAAPRDLLPAVWGSAVRRVERDERRAITKDAAAAGLDDDPDGWLDRVGAEVLAALAAVPGGLTAAEARAAVPAVDVGLPTTTGGGSAVSRALRHLGLTAEAVRATNTGHWRVLRPRWMPTETWLPDVPVALDEGEGWRELVRRWLAAFGPGTEADLVWWLGATKGIVRHALAELDAVAVSLDGTDEVGWLLPDDLDELGDPGPWTALLPILDPTTMGWKQRGWYLGGRREQLFDRSNNAGTTAWVDGRIVGCWVQDAAGTVELVLLERVGAPARRALEERAAELTAWLAGTRVTSSIPSPAMKAHRYEASTATGRTVHRGHPRRRA